MLQKYDNKNLPWSEKIIDMVYLINASLSSGIFPNILKTSNMTLTHKKDSKLKYLNHRPISIL